MWRRLRSLSRRQRALLAITAGAAGAAAYYAGSKYLESRREAEREQAVQVRRRCAPRLRAAGARAGPTAAPADRATPQALKAQQKQVEEEREAEQKCATRARSRGTAGRLP